MNILPFTLGIELEFFIEDKEKNIVPSILIEVPHDNDGILGELRGEPSNNAYGAVFSVIGQKARIEDYLSKTGHSMLLENWLRKDSAYQKMLEKVWRKSAITKDRIKWQNLYGLPRSKKTTTTTVPVCTSQSKRN